MRETYCVLSERKGLLLRLQRRHQKEQEGRRSEQTEVRQARLDRRCVHGEESVAFSGIINVDLDSEGSIVSTCTEHYKFEFWISINNSTLPSVCYTVIYMVRVGLGFG